MGCAFYIVIVTETATLNMIFNSLEEKREKRNTVSLFTIGVIFLPSKVVDAL